ncbi:MAG TPA: class I SAM-dependent methyltransferase, partial [Fimbriimonadaceae bacterium]|nr:class I SAM-dependent methyltransferase [Fimbriimonadaceae bacterium]
MPKCEICDKTEFDLIATDIREGAGKIAKCANCGLVIQDLGWSAQQLREYYEKEYQHTNSLVAGAELEAKRHFEERLLTIAPIFDRVKPLLGKDKTVLEIGAGAGALLFRCKPLVNKCVATEMNTPIVEFMRSHLGIEAYASDINSIDFKEKFDVIIMINT